MEKGDNIYTIYTQGRFQLYLHFLSDKDKIEVNMAKYLNIKSGQWAHGFYYIIICTFLHA